MAELVISKYCCYSIITYIRIAEFVLAFSCIGFGMSSSAGMAGLRTCSEAGSLA